jgi:hypothetical protein
MSRYGLGALLVAACLASSAAAAGQFTSFTVPGAKNTVATAINASGIVTGFYSSTAHKDGGFVRTPDGTITTFSAPGLKSTTPTAINSAGAITGYSGAEQSFVRNPDGSFEVFQIDGARYTTATAINASGYISGTFSNADNSGGSFLRAPNGTFFIVSASKDAETSVYGLNDANLMVGQIGFGSSPQGFVFNGGAVTTLDAGTSLTTINDPGLAAGIQVRDNDETRGLTLDMHGHVKPFGPKVSDMDVGHIDNAGNIVGDYLDRRSRFHGFVYSTGSGVFTSIDEPDAGHRQPFAGTRITGSNDSGVLAGFYMSNRYKNTAFIWTP